MMATSLIIYFYFKSFDNSLQYVVYITYSVGLLWTLFTFSRTQAPDTGFGKYFTEGFKCFIVVTLLMVLFTYVFLKMQPDLKEQMAINYKAEMQKNVNMTPDEVLKNTVQMKKYFEVMLTSMAMFSYLLIGAFITAITAAVLMVKKKQ